MSQSAALAGGAEVRRPTRLEDAADQCSTAATGLSLAAVHGEAPERFAALVPPGVDQRVVHSGPHGVDQARQARGAKPAGRNARIDTSAPECLGGVDVSDARHDPLIEQRGLDSDAASVQRPAERPCVEGRIVRVGAEDGCCRAARTQRRRGQGTRVDQRYDDAVVEREREARVRRKGSIRTTNVPVPVHAELDVQGGPIIEREVLVLAAALDRRDLPANKTCGDVGGERSPGGSVVRGDSRDSPSDDHRTQTPDRGFDFGELGHWGEYTTVPVPSQVRCAGQRRA